MTYIDERNHEIVAALRHLGSYDRVTLKEVAEVVGCSRKTVERRVSRMRRAGLISAEREGPYVWHWSFDGYDRAFKPSRKTANAINRALKKGSILTPQRVFKSPSESFFEPKVTPQYSFQTPQGDVLSSQELGKALFLDPNFEFVVVKRAPQGQNTPPTSTPPKGQEEIPQATPQSGGAVSPKSGLENSRDKKISMSHVRNTGVDNNSLCAGGIPVFRATFLQNEVPKLTPQVRRVAPNSYEVTIILDNIQYRKVKNSNHCSVHTVARARTYKGDFAAVPKVSGPQTSLKLCLEQALTSSTPRDSYSPEKFGVKAAVPKNKTRKNSALKNIKPETYRVRPALTRKDRAHIAVEDYSTTDMRLLLEELWREKGWRGFPPKWTLKDKKLVKNILEEQGGENTVAYFEYVMKNWSVIQQRYKITGGPNVNVIYSFRSSWLHEALNGVSQTGPTVEYYASQVTEEDHFF